MLDFGLSYAHLNMLSPQSPSLSPYPGLTPYSEDRAPDFFGRDDEIRRGVDRLRQNNFLAIVGPTGIGKTSLINAGIVPALRSLNPPAYDPIVHCRLGSDPVVGITTALRQLHDLGTASAPRPLLIVDQFEELYTLADSSDRKNALRETVRLAYEDKIGLIIALRSDYFQTVLESPDLSRLFEDSAIFVGPLSDFNLRRAILEPAKRAGIALEAALVDRIVTDRGSEIGILPLLQMALVALVQELGKRPANRPITLSDYEALLSLHGESLERIWQSLSASEQRTMRSLMLRLTTAEGLRRVVDFQDFDEEERLQIDRLLSERVLAVRQDTARGNPVVEITHEVFLRHWPRLQEWRNEEYAYLKQRSRISEEAARWEENNCDTSYLLTGGSLDAARALVRERPNLFGARERDFINRSLLAEHRSTALSEIFRRFGLSDLERQMAERAEQRARIQAEIVDIGEQVRRLQAQRSDLDEQLRQTRVENDTMSPQIFLSYASEDFGEVKQLYEKLKALNWRPWLDRENLLPGVDWDREINREIKGSHFVLVCLSKRSLTKRGYVQKEIRTALKAFEEVPQGQTFLIPVRLEDCAVPEELTKYHYADIFRENGFEKLLKSILKTWGELSGDRQQSKKV